MKILFSTRGLASGFAPHISVDRYRSMARFRRAGSLTSLFSKG
ncbi:hypothetical protein [Spirosoma luteum]|nr:hypothetical protein [Spirosoma luteum]